MRDMVSGSYKREDLGECAMILARLKPWMFMHSVLLGFIGSLKKQMYNICKIK